LDTLAAHSALDVKHAWSSGKSMALTGMIDEVDFR
jgi:hypothetical protein